MRYSPKLPLELDEQNQFISISDPVLNIRQKLKTILLTNPGEKIYDPQFGIGIKKYIFEPSAGIIVSTGGQQKIISINSFESDINNKLLNQVAEYAPEIVIKNFSINVEDVEMTINIEYSYRNYIDDSLTVTVGT